MPPCFPYRKSFSCSRSRRPVNRRSSRWWQRSSLRSSSGWPRPGETWMSGRGRQVFTGGHLKLDLYFCVESAQSWHRSLSKRPTPVWAFILVRWCVGVTLQLHHQNASWRWMFFAAVLSFFVYFKQWWLKPSGSCWELELTVEQVTFTEMNEPQKRGNSAHDHWTDQGRRRVNFWCLSGHWATWTRKCVSKMYLTTGRFDVLVRRKGLIFNINGP